MSGQDDFVFETRDLPVFAPLENSRIIGRDIELEDDLKKIPDKLAFKIGEVADLVGVKPYVLRYWESEFEALSPKKSRSNQRMYEQKDVETLLHIKKLLYRDRFSIEGARAALKKMKKQKVQVSEMASMLDHNENLKDQVQLLVSQIQHLKRVFE